jgi:spore germination protein
MGKIMPSLDENIRLLESRFNDCGDYVRRRFSSSDGRGLYMAYMDLLINRGLLDLTIVKELTAKPLNPSEINLPTVDVFETGDIEKAVAQILTGDAVLLAEGHPTAFIISAKGFPNRGVPSAETEITLLGSKEAFTEAMRVNTTLVRRRIRDTRLKVKQLRVGRRSQTDVALMYCEDIARPKVVEELTRRIAAVDIDGVSDSGSLAQLICESHAETGEGRRHAHMPVSMRGLSRWLSPFPLTQLTERPDKTASAILEGRVAVFVDNCPFAMLAPATFVTFFQSAEDYYNRWQVMSLTRLLRYAAALLAVTLPGFYLAVALFHPSMLPLSMITKMAAARQHVPFPGLIEILLMDAAFELLREAGIRLPGAAGGTIGIVGGLIIGQSAVEAGLVSPIVVIVVALTGIASFAVPNITLVNGFRLVKYFILLLSATLGFLGFWLALLFTLTHLASLNSFGIPYLMPFTAGDLNDGQDKKDGLARWPLSMLKRRPFFAREGSRKR